MLSTGRKKLFVVRWAVQNTNAENTFNRFLPHETAILEYFGLPRAEPVRLSTPLSGMTAMAQTLLR